MEWHNPTMELPVNSNKCFCRYCGEHFNGVKAFEKHRRGMQCNDPAEVGLLKNKKGWWVTELWINKGIN